MNTHDSTRICQNCNQSKPLTAFALGRDSQGNVIYSNICDTCRDTFYVLDDDERGGKQGSLTINHEHRELQKKQEKDKLEKFHIEKQDYLNVEDKKLKDSNLLNEDNSNKLSNQRNQAATTKRDKQSGLFSHTEPHKTMDNAKLNNLAGTRKLVTTNKDTQQIKKGQSDRSVLHDFLLSKQGTSLHFNLKTVDKKTAAQHTLDKTEGKISKSTGSIFSHAKEKATTEKQSQEEKVQEAVNFMRNTWGKR